MKPRQTLAFLGLALLPFLAASCSSEPLEEEGGPALKEGLKRRSLILRPKGFTQFKDIRRSTYQIPVAFLDADSTLRLSASGAQTPTSAQDVYILPCVAQRLAQLARDGYFIAIVSNQPEIGRKQLTREAVDAALMATVQGIVKQGGVVDYFDYAENEGDFMKPRTHMADRLEAFLADTFNTNYRIDRWRSFVVGDQAYQRSGTRPADQGPEGRSGTHANNSDRLFAEALFGPSMPWQPHFFESAVFFGWRRRSGVDAFTSMAEVKKFTALPNACCDVVHSCAGDAPPAGEAPQAPKSQDARELEQMM
jgi:histidinol phosphatase-like enzyme